MKYEQIIEYLCSTAGPALENAGVSDERVNKRTEAGMAKSLCRYICGVDGDDGCDYFKIDDDDQIFAYNGKYFEKSSKEWLLRLIVTVMEMMNVGIVYQTGSAKVIRDYIIDIMKGDERCKMVPDRRYVCFNNGVYDLKEMKFKDFSVEYKTDIVLDFDYAAGARSALWDKVLAHTVPDESMRETFHQYCGCFLLDRKAYKIEYICFVVGEGQNGKSIICKAVVNTLGPTVASSYSPDQLFKSQGSQTDYRLADVNGKIVNYCDDVSNKDFSGGEFKAFVSGGEFTGRHPYSQRPTKVDKVPLMLCCANNIPPTTDDTEGFFRRFLIIMAPNHIDERDKDPMLEMKLRAPEVRAAIFNWMLEGYKEVIAKDGKIEIAGTVKDIIEDMKSNSNSLRRWIKDMGYVAAEPDSASAPGWKSLKEWVQIYVKYCQDYAETPRSRKAVTEQFKKMGAHSSRRSDGMWYYLEVAPTESAAKEKKETLASIREALGMEPDNPDIPF